jgi:hypothetical protein
MGSEGWMTEFCEELFEVIGDDLLRVVEEVRTSGKQLPSLKSTITIVTLNLDHPSCFVEFRPIVICNCIYKIIVKIITVRINLFLSNFISPQQFGFLKVHLIHEAIGPTQEGMHTIKNQKRVVSVLKIDLSKAYDCDPGCAFDYCSCELVLAWIW